MSSIRDSGSAPDKKSTEINDLPNDGSVEGDNSVKGGAINPCTHTIRPVQRDIVPCVLPGRTL